MCNLLKIKDQLLIKRPNDQWKLSIPRKYYSEMLYVEIIHSFKREDSNSRSIIWPWFEWIWMITLLFVQCFVSVIRCFILENVFPEVQLRDEYVKLAIYFILRQFYRSKVYIYAVAKEGIVLWNILHFVQPCIAYCLYEMVNY